MNKRSKLIVTTMMSLILILSVVLLVACNQTQAGKLQFIVDDVVYYSIDTNGNTTISLPEQPQKTDYTFRGWYYDKDVWQQPFSIDDFSNKSLNGIVKIYAYFEKNTVEQPEHKIMFVVDGEIVHTVNSNGNEIIKLPQAPVVDGYSFKGWYFDNNTWQEQFLGTEYQNTELSSDIYIYGRYELTTHTLYFMIGNQSVGTVTTAGYENIQLPEAPQREDYNFIGWFFDNNIWQNRLTETTYKNKPLTEDLNVYGCYQYSPSTATKYEVRFWANGQNIKTILSSGKEFISVPTAPEVDGYEFIGWYTDKDVWQQPFWGDSYINKDITAPIDVYARYELIEAQKYPVTFWADGTLVQTIMSSGYQTISLPVAPNKDGYEFKGWYLDNNTWLKPFYSDYFLNSAITAPVEIYARYDKVEVIPQEYSVTFWANGNIVSSVMSSGYEYIASPVAPYVQGYNFVGWFLDKDTWSTKFDGYNFVSSAITSAINIYAKYEEIPQYKVNFWADGSLVRSLYSKGYETIALPTAPDKTNYQFVGWYLDNNTWTIEFDGNNYVNSAITSEVNIYAYYVKVEIKYTVDFVTNGGTDVESMYVSVIENSPTTTRQGPYEFGGWYFDSNFNKVVSFPFYPQDNVTLYAKWIEVDVLFTIDSNGYITGVNAIPEDGNLVIPSKVNGINVVGINSSTFQFNSNIKSVYIPGSIKVLNSSIFRYCSNLQSVTLEEGITSIGEELFRGCSSLTHVQLPSTLQKIGNDAFRDTKLAQVTIPDSVTHIGKYAFYGCEKLVSIDLGQVQTMGEGVFQYCKSLTSITLPSSLRSLDNGGNFMFYFCESLRDITVLNKNLQLTYSFLDETAYEADASNWQNGVLYLDSYLIKINRDFSNTSTYTVKQGTLVIANNAFNSNFNSKLSSVTLPDGLKIIGAQAFYRCQLLQNCNIPDSVEKIGKEAFASTLLLKDNQTNYIGNWLINYYPSSSETTITIREGTVGIADGQITTNTSNITKIILPDSLKYIGEENFLNFRVVESVSAPSSLISIGNDAFMYCYKLTEFDMSKCSNLQYIGDKAFSWCEIYTSIYIPKSVTYLGDSVFNQIEGATVSFEIEQNQIPDTWNANWQDSYADITMVVHWGVSNPSINN